MTTFLVGRCPEAYFFVASTNHSLTFLLLGGTTFSTVVDGSLVDLFCLDQEPLLGHSILMTFFKDIANNTS